MENREFITTNKYFVFGLLVLVGLLAAYPTNTYEVTTHANLTTVMFDFYNQHFPSQKLAEEFRPQLMEGAMREDDPPRWLNHFYDPVHDRGLTTGAMAWLKSKAWAQDNRAQLALMYKASPLAWVGLAQGEPLSYTWQEAIRIYNEGDHKTAFFILGHIVHLLEDAAVPDHTRNDPHLEGSPYEEFARTLIPRVASNKPPIILNSLDEYFDAMAKYSNNNFYSKDSINNKEYKNPVADYEGVDGDYLYKFKIDESGSPYHLARSDVDYTWTKEKTDLNDDANKILTDYWNLLSQKSVQYGAGLINLFFREAERAKKNSPAISVANAQERPQTFLASALDAFRDLVNPGDNFEEVAVVDLRTGKVAGNKSDVADKTNKIDKADKINTTNKSDRTATSNTATVAAAAPTPVCTWETPQNPAHQKLIINEVNWVGSTDNPNDEWLELKNMSGGALDLSGWQLVSQTGNLKIKLAAGGTVNAGGFIVLHRGTEYKGALRNNSEGLRLYDNNCVLLDEVVANPSWPAGDNAVKRSMERAPDWSWHNGNPNSPGQENSPAVTGGGGGGGGGGSASTASAMTVAATSSTAGTVSATSTSDWSSKSDVSDKSDMILISEALFDAAGSDAGKEFIELYNPTDQAVDLTGWAIQHTSASGATSRKNITSGSTISSYHFFLIWLGVSPSSTVADMEWLSGSLNNTAATITLLNSTTSVDSVAYSSSTIMVTNAGQSIERKALINGACASAQEANELMGNGCDMGNDANDWQIRAAPLPQNTHDLPEPRGATATTSSTVELVSSTTPQFIRDLAIFPDSRTASTTSYLISLTIDKYPFIPDAFFEQGTGWKAMVFYLNRTPSSSALYLEPIAQPIDRDGVLAVRYEECAGPNTWSPSQALLMADDNAHCNVDGGAFNQGLIPRQAEDNQILFGTALTTSELPLTPNDYVTVAYYAPYGFNPWDGRIPYFKLVNVDSRKFYFQTTNARPQPPRFPSDAALTTTFDRDNARLTISWPSATDPDSLDNLIKYEYRWSADEAWQSYEQTSITRLVAPGDDLQFEVRAHDEFGNYSSVLQQSWRYPATTFVIEQINLNDFSYPFGQANVNCHENNAECLWSVSAQSFTTLEATTINTVALRLRQDVASDYSDLALTVRPDRDGQPDMATELGRSAVRQLLQPDPERNIAFNFPTPLLPIASTTYWLVLEVADYPNAGIPGAGPYRNTWQNRVAWDGGADPYAGGVARWGDVGYCSRVDMTNCRFRDYSVPTDWYFRVGLTE